MLDLYLIRHAESEMNNRSDLIGGRTNHTPLSEKGKRQATLLGRRFHDSGVFFDNFYSSTARRTVETAEIVIEQLGRSIDEVVQTQILLELDQGDWEGKPRIEIYTPEVLQAINSDNWNFTPPNGESQRTVEERMLGWVDKNLISRYKTDSTVGGFTHGVSVKCLLRGIMGFSPKITYKITLDNTSITRLKYSETGWHLLAINDISHLFGRE